MLFTDLAATNAPALAGGDNSFRFKWESSINSSTWGDATGTNNGLNYNPDELSASYPGKEYYRRTVFSGIHDVCTNKSAPVLLADYPVLTNNSISLNQTICSGSVPATITGSLPLNGAGAGSYTYTWQDSTRNHTWTNITGFVNVTNQNFLPPALTDTTRYRRIVYSSACSNISNSIIINVHKPIINNNISLISGSGPDTTICSGATPDLLKGNAASGGTNIPGDYAYSWFYSLDNIVWNPVSSAGTGLNYQPGALTDTNLYKRKVISGTCSTESNIIRIIVLPLISNNTISADQTVCYNTVPAQIAGSDPAGGTGSGYTYKWEESPDGSTWSGATGTITGKNYQPPALTIPMKYKRVVISGTSGCCINVSNIVSIGIYVLPTGLITTVTDTICLGSQVPLKIHLTGATRWKVVYTENATQITLNNVLANDTTLLIKPSTTTNFASFSYSLFSVQDKNGCIATSLSGSRIIDVYKIPKSVAGSDATVCGQKYTLSATPSLGTGKWYYPAGVVDSTVNGPVVTVTVDSITTAWQTRCLFIWKENDWNCVDKDSVMITFDRRPKIVDAGPDRDLYSFENVDTLRAAKPDVGTGIWSVISGSSNITNDTITNNLSPGENEFEWTVTNGLCVSADRMIISSYELIIPEGFSPNDDGINDEFYIKDLDMNYNEVSLKILNSAGTEVFFTSNIGGGIWTNWKGQNSKGFLPEGTYYYLLNIKSKRTNGIVSKSGFIILKRY
jgi:gliding motility-associated-like protein